MSRGPHQAAREARFRRALAAMAEDPAAMRRTFRRLWHHDVIFCDPFKHTRGVAAFIDHVDFMTRYGRVIAVEIGPMHIDGATARAVGVLVFRCTEPVFTFRLKFSTCMQFDAKNRIVHHEDRWLWLGSLAANLRHWLRPA